MSFYHANSFSTSLPCLFSFLFILASFSVCFSLPVPFSLSLPPVLVPLSHSFSLSFSSTSLLLPFSFAVLPHSPSCLLFFFSTFLSFSLSELTVCLSGKEGLCDANRSNADYSQRTLTHTHTHLSQRQLISQDVDTAQGHRIAPVGNSACDCV